MGRLHGTGADQRLPRHHLPPLQAWCDPLATGRALRALHGGRGGLRDVQATLLRPAALGVLSALRRPRTGEVL